MTEEKIINVVKNNKDWLLFTDGASRGNPGHSSVGYVLYDKNGKRQLSAGEYIGISSSSIAEYQALRVGLEKALELGAKNIVCLVDNLMIVEHLNGKHDVDNRFLLPVNDRIYKLINQFDSIEFRHVKREYNIIADNEANKAIDRYVSDFINL